MVSHEQMMDALDGGFYDNCLPTLTYDDEPPGRCSRTVGEVIQDSAATMSRMNDYTTASCTHGPLFSSTDSEILGNGGRVEEMRTKLEDIKNWTVTKFRNTKQAVRSSRLSEAVFEVNFQVLEHFGISERTIDPVLEQKISVLRQQQRTYAHLLALTQGFTFHVRQTALMQARMTDAMDALTKTEPHAAVSEE